MQRYIHLYDAFSGINSGDKSRLIKFLLKNSEEKGVSVIEDAIDYALKIKPSFGGYIFTAWEEKQLVGLVLVNKTGMGGFTPGHLMVYACVDKASKNKAKVLKELIQRSVKRCKGEMALHLRPDNPALPIFKSLGFQEQFLELRLPAKVGVAGTRAV